MKRLRYFKQENGDLVTKSLNTPNEEVIVTIKPTGDFAVCKTDGQLVHNNTVTGPTPLATTKKLVKQALMSLGVVFEGEVRPRLSDIPSENIGDS